MRATIVHLGRAQALGERRRVASWEDILRRGGWNVSMVSLLTCARASAARAGTQAARTLLQGRVAPEAAAWSWRAGAELVRDTTPDIVICITARAYHPRLAAGPWRTGLDFVDRLSVSYRDRSQLVTGTAKRQLFRQLANAAERIERSPAAGLVRIAAGRTDAESLDAHWVPNVISLPRRVDRQPDHDVIFVGNLSYSPNIAAVARLARLWPSLLARRPSSTAIVAGAAPSTALRAEAARLGWTILPDFADLADTLAKARVAVAPLSFASGIQNKVLEAAAAGMPQVVDEAALAGFDIGFPVRRAATDELFVAELADLLDDDAAQRAEGVAARQHIAEHYTAAVWSRWPAEVLASSGRSE